MEDSVQNKCETTVMYFKLATNKVTLVSVDIRWKKLFQRQKWFRNPNENVNIKIDVSDQNQIWNKLKMSTGRLESYTEKLFT